MIEEFPLILKSSELMIKTHHQYQYLVLNCRVQTYRIYTQNTISLTIQTQIFDYEPKRIYLKMENWSENVWFSSILVNPYPIFRNS